MRLDTNEGGVTCRVSHLEVQNDSSYLSEAVTSERLQRIHGESRDIFVQCFAVFLSERCHGGLVKTEQIHLGD